MACPCNNCMNQVDLEQLVDNHDFDVNHHTHAFTQDATALGTIVEDVDYAAGGLTDQAQTFWQPWLVDYAAGPGAATNTAPALMATWGAATPQMAFVTGGPSGADEAWMVLRDTGGTWQWHQLA